MIIKIYKDIDVQSYVYINAHTYKRAFARMHMFNDLKPSIEGVTRKSGFLFNSKREVLEKSINA